MARHAPTRKSQTSADFFLADGAQYWARVLGWPTTGIDARSASHTIWDTGKRCGCGRPGSKDHHDDGSCQSHANKNSPTENVYSRELRAILEQSSTGELFDSVDNDIRLEFGLGGDAFYGPNPVTKRPDSNCRSVQRRSLMRRLDVQKQLTVDFLGNEASANGPRDKGARGGHGLTA
jgi:hypothetical protein